MESLKCSIRDSDHVLVLDFHNDLLQIVKVVIEKHPLKAADAIHLSSALWLKLSSKADVTFVASAFEPTAKLLGLRNFR